MIRNEQEYQEVLGRLKQDEDLIALQTKQLQEAGLSPEQVQRALEPMISFNEQLKEEVEWYNKVKRRDFGTIRNMVDVGKYLIALRIANGISQRELAQRLGVSESQISRDERNDYHGIKLERIQKILEAMNESLEIKVVDKERPLNTGNLAFT